MGGEGEGGVRFLPWRNKVAEVSEHERSVLCAYDDKRGTLPVVCQHNVVTAGPAVAR